jgi:hypothetical protein
MLFFFRQIVDDAFPFQVTRQGLPSAAVFLAILTSAVLGTIVVVVGARLSIGCFCRRLPSLPGFREQGQLICRQLLAFPIALRIQQLMHQGLDLAPLRELTSQLRHQIQHHLL